MSVHDKAVPGSAQNAKQLCDGKSIDVLAHCGNANKERVTKYQRKVRKEARSICLCSVFQNVALKTSDAF